MPIDHYIQIETGGDPNSMGYRDWRRPICSCGWRGRKHYNYENFAYTDCSDEADNHVRDARRKELEANA